MKTVKILSPNWMMRKETLTNGFCIIKRELTLVSFIAYLIATLFFGGAVKGAKSEASL